MQQRVAKRLGMTDFTILSDPTLDEIELRAPRIQPPASLASFCTTEKWERVAHTYGKSFHDLAMVYKRRFPNPPDIVAYPRDEKDIAAVLDWCGENGYAAVPFGGGSSVTVGSGKR